MDWYLARASYVFQNSGRLIAPYPARTLSLRQRCASTQRKKMNVNHINRCTVALAPNTVITGCCRRISNCVKQLGLVLVKVFGQHQQVTRPTNPCGLRIAGMREFLCQFSFLRSILRRSRPRVLESSHREVRHPRNGSASPFGLLGR